MTGMLTTTWRGRIRERHNRQGTCHILLCVYHQMTCVPSSRADTKCGVRSGGVVPYEAYLVIVSDLMTWVCYTFCGMTSVNHGPGRLSAEKYALLVRYTYVVGRGVLHAEITPEANISRGYKGLVERRRVESPPARYLWHSSEPTANHPDSLVGSHINMADWRQRRHPRVAILADEVGYSMAAQTEILLLLHSIVLPDMGRFPQRYRTDQSCSTAGKSTRTTMTIRPSLSPWKRPVSMPRVPAV